MVGDYSIKFHEEVLCLEDQTSLSLSSPKISQAKKGLLKKYKSGVYYTSEFYDTFQHKPN